MSSSDKDNHVKPLLIAVSAPSGAGKSTLCNRLIEEFPRMHYSISCTTRAPRGKEKDGVDYYFLSKPEFKKRIKNNEFIEYAKVHGNFYGTLEETISYSMDTGKHVLLDIDVQGVDQIRASLERLGADHPLRKAFVDVFITPPSMEELEARLRGRGTDEEETILKRLNNAAEEMSHADKYMHTVVNDDLDTAYADLKKVLQLD